MKSCNTAQVNLDNFNVMPIFCYGHLICGVISFSLPSHNGCLAKLEEFYYLSEGIYTHRLISVLNHYNYLCLRLTF